MQRKQNAPKKKKKGRVHNPFDSSTLTERQRVSVETVERIAEAIGAEVYFYASYKDENGERVYKNAEGEIEKAPNGFYDPKDGSIHLDINAGDTGKSLILYTAVHELTHLIKDMSAVKFDTLADFLMEQYHKKGVNIAELIDAQIEKAKANDREIDYDTAYEEVVADSMETMLADGRLVERLQELNKKDKNIVERIAEYFKELARKIRAVYEKMTPESREGQLVAEMVEETERLQDLFFDALKDVAETGVVVQESVTGADVKMSYNGIREGLAKNALDKLSEKLGDRFPLSRNFEKVILADDTPLVINDVQKGAIKRQSNSKNRIESFYATGKRAFQNSYGIKTEVNIKQLGIKATLHQSVVSESLSKVINSKALKANDGKGENEQNLIDLIPHLKNILENSILLSVERVQHTDNKKTSLYEYRLYNVYKYIENNVEQKRCIVTTITQNLYDSDTYAYRSIENVITERSLPTGNGDMSTSLNDDIYTVSQLYRFVKKIKRENGGIKYSPSEKLKFLFSYDRRKDGTLYSERASSRSMLASALEQFVQSEEERAVLDNYKNDIEEIEGMETRLAELREEINDMQFTRGERSTEFLDKLAEKREEARKITAKLTRYDESILKLEGTQTLKTLISRERTAAARLQKQKDAKAKERAARRREIAETRRKTLNIAHGIESLLSRETKGTVKN